MHKQSILKNESILTQSNSECSKPVRKCHITYSSKSILFIKATSNWWQDFLQMKYSMQIGKTASGKKKER